MVAKKTGVGKGLDALIPAGNKKTVVKKDSEPVIIEKIVEKKGVETLKITEVEPNREQPRKNFNEDALLELSDSIKQYGVIQPLIVQKKQDRYEINQVTGPDEWHEPVNNNLYTNYLARWNLRYVLSLLESLKKEETDAYHALVAKTGLTEEETAQWNVVQEKIYLPRKEGTKLLEQFEGYFELDNVTIEKYDENDWPVRPEALKTKKTRETQINKQADVVMLLHLMGNEFDEETIKENYAYYEKRTLHGSSLSPSIYSVMGLKVGDDSKAYRYLRRAAFLDLLNMQGNTREGVHAANTGGVWQTIVFGFAGVSQREDGMLKVCPNMPKEWQKLSFRLHYRGAWLEITSDGSNQAEVRRLAGDPVEVEVNGSVKTI